jgi:pimeloyl-ACP methyl ester carboxylesterase
MKRIDNRLTLKDGRVLGYLETGDLTGAPLFLFHGLHSSRLEVKCVEQQMKNRGIRFIGIDRPGMGHSTYQKDRKVLDMVQDVTALADSLKLDKFSVLGVSSGAKYALACAHKIPHRLHSCSILSGAAPMEYLTLDMPRFNRFFISLLQRFPSLTQVVFWILYGRFSKRTSSSDKFLGSILHVLDEVDKELLTHKQIKDDLLDSFHESYLQGSKGVAYDAGFDIQKDAWGFDPAEISFAPIHFWHGGADRGVPFSMTKQLIDKIPQATLTFYPDEGHLSLIFHKIDEVTEILGQRVGK